MYIYVCCIMETQLYGHHRKYARKCDCKTGRKGVRKQQASHVTMTAFRTATVFVKVFVKVFMI